LVGGPGPGLLAPPKSGAACECGAEEQTVDHVILQCPIHRSPHGLHGLTVLDDETIQWLLNTCPDIQCGQAGYELAQTMKKRVYYAWAQLGGGHRGRVPPLFHIAGI